MKSAKSTKFKILVWIGITVVCLFVFAAIIIVGFVNTSYDEEHQKGKTEGTDFGKTTDQAGCIQEGLIRSKTIPQNFENIIKFKMTYLGEFEDYCLPASRPTANFCQQVPISFDEAAYDWASEQCHKLI